MGSEAGSQTSFYRSVNKASQCASVGVGASEEERQRQVRSATLQTFLNRVVGDMEDALQRNETFDVFQPPCSAIALDAITLGSQGDNSMQELKTFTDLEFSKNKALPAIDWHPTRPGEVVVAASNNAGFSGQVLLWDLAEAHEQLRRRKAKLGKGKDEDEDEGRLLPVRF